MTVLDTLISRSHATWQAGPNQQQSYFLLGLTNAFWRITEEALQLTSMAQPEIEPDFVEPGQYA